MCVNWKKKIGVRASVYSIVFWLFFSWVVLRRRRLGWNLEALIEKEKRKKKDEKSNRIKKHDPLLGPHPHTRHGKS